MPEPGRGVVLVGLPGSGKTTVGRLLAARLGRPFQDTDEIIGARTGIPAAAYLRTHGEGAFRAVETAAVDEACRDPHAVVATGGGALDDPLTRWRLWEHGRVLWLRAEQGTLLSRLAKDPVPRPLLRGDPDAQLAALALTRAPFYRAADVVLDAAPDAERVATAAADVMSPSLPADRRLFDALEPRHHPIGPREARIVYGHDLDATLRAVIAELGGRPSFVVDRRVAGAIDVPAAGRLELRGGEGVKSFASLERVLAFLVASGAERGDPVVGVGGGSVGDLAGLAAALHARGAPYVSVPTTLLAQTDAALGGKVAVNLPAGKNVVGAFWPASAVVADGSFLGSLPSARLRDGLAEAVKAAIIGDRSLWELIADRGALALAGEEAVRYAVTERAARVKLAVVRRDPFERGERRQLNLGHTVGHALEMTSGYRLHHGDAVALGLRAAAALAVGRGADPELGQDLDAVLAGLGFPLHHSFDATVVTGAMLTDKKRSGGRQRWLLPMAVGTVVEADDLTDAEVAVALRVIGES